jgi:Na+/proline symporter
VDTTGLRRGADLARTGVAGGVEVAHQLGSATLLDSVRSAFVYGMDIMLWTCGGIALGCVLLAVIFLRKLR